MHDGPFPRIDVDLNRLRHAVAIAREGSFAAAAKSIPLSQPALTRSIQSLERRYGVQLFDRRKSGAVLTVAGVAFLAAAEEILWAAQRADRHLAQIASGEWATVRFGVEPVVGACVLPTVLPELARTGLRFEIRRGSNAELSAILARNEIDFFIGAVTTDIDGFSATHGFRVEPIEASTPRIGLYVRGGHPLADGRPDVTFADFPVATTSFTRKRLGSDGFERLGLRQPTIEYDDLPGLVAVAEESDFIIVANRMIHNLRPGRDLSMLPVDVPEGQHPRQWMVVSSSHSALTAPVVDVAGILSAAVTRSHRD